MHLQHPGHGSAGRLGTQGRPGFCPGSTTSESAQHRRPAWGHLCGDIDGRQSIGLDAHADTDKHLRVADADQHTGDADTDEHSGDADEHARDADEHAGDADTDEHSGDADEHARHADPDEHAGYADTGEHGYTDTDEHNRLTDADAADGDANRDPADRDPNRHARDGDAHGDAADRNSNGYAPNSDGHGNTDQPIGRWRGWRWLYDQRSRDPRQPAVLARSTPRASSRAASRPSLGIRRLHVHPRGGSS